MDKQHVMGTGVNIGTTLYNAALEFTTPTGVLVVIISPQLLKAMHMITERNLREYEERWGVLPVNATLQHNLGLHEG